MKLKKAKIIIQPLSDVKTDWAKALKGDIRSVQGKNEIVFTSLASLAKVLSPARLELLGVIFTEKPKSIYALAKMVKRDFKNVHSDVRILSGVGLIDLQEASSGKRDASKPTAKYSGFEVDLAA